VLARMMWCQDRLLQSGLLQTQEQSEATLARAANRDRFIASQGVIEAEARFTRDGALLWTAARDWVREAG
jgi:hypothetical protein